MLEHNGRFNSRDYDKFERMELTESPVRDAIHEFESFESNNYIYRGIVKLDGELYYGLQEDEADRERKVVKFSLKLVN